jgi:hypothetical protein
MRRTLMSLVLAAATAVSPATPATAGHDRGPAATPRR